MKNKSIFTIITLMVSILVVIGFSINVGQVTPKIQQDAKSTAVTPEENLPIVSTTASLANYSVESLVSKSTAIVEGEIISLDYFDFNINTYTKAKLKVLNSYTDDVKVGDVITIVDLGGITTLDKIKLNDGYEGKPGTVSPIIEKDKTTKVQVLFNSSPLMKLNERIVFFGVESKDDFYKLSEKYYITLGSYQGRFKITDNLVERYTEDPSDTNSKMKKSDLEEKIKTLKNKK